MAKKEGKPVIPEFVRMQSKWDSSVLMVGGKKKSHFIGIYPNEVKILCSHRNLYRNVCSSLHQLRQKLEIAPMSFNRGMINK
jgi:hypothetical protein